MNDTMNDGPIDSHNNGNNSLSQPPDQMNNSMEISDHNAPNGNGGGGEPQINNGTNDNSMIGSAHLRPVFVGNLDYNCSVEDLEDLFLRPVRRGDPMPVDRVDLKRGYAFVFFQEARNQNDKDRLERYVDEINGMYVTSSHKHKLIQYRRASKTVGFCRSSSSFLRHRVNQIKFIMSSLLI